MEMLFVLSFPRGCESASFCYLDFSPLSGSKTVTYRGHGVGHQKDRTRKT